MNWMLFLFVVAVGVSSGAMFRRGQLTQAEARSLVLGRVLVGLVLAVSVPSKHNTVAFFVLGSSELARGVEYLAGNAVDKLLAKREARRWLLH